MSTERRTPRSAVRIAALALAALLPTAAAALTVQRATVRVDPAGADRVRLSGRLEGLTLDGVETVRVALDGVGFTLPLAEFRRQRGQLRYRSRTAGPGIRSFRLEPSRGRFALTLDDLVLGPLRGPLTAELQLGSASYCSRLPLAERRRAARGPGRQPAPRRLVLAGPSGTCRIATPSFDPPALVVGDAPTVSVQVEVTNAPGVADVRLLDGDSDETLCTLHDDGDAAHGDAQAGDGRYGCVLAVDAATPRQRVVVAAAKVDGVEETSPAALLRVSAPLTDDDIAVVLGAQAQAADTWNAKRAEHGDGVRARLETVAVLRGLAGVESVALTDEAGSITVQYASGVVGGLTLETRDGDATPLAAASPARGPTAGAEGEPDEDALVVGSRQVFLWDPGFFGVSEANAIRALFEQSTCPRFTVTSYEGTAATLAALDEMPTAGTAILVTHGARKRVNGAWQNCMYTTEPTTEQRMKALAVQLQHQQVAVGHVMFREPHFGLCLLPAAVAALPGSFDRAVLWAGYCWSGLATSTAGPMSTPGAGVAVRSLANAYFAKGVRSHLGFTRKVSDSWLKALGPRLFTDLVTRFRSTRQAWEATEPKSDPGVPPEVAARFVALPQPASSTVYLKATLTPKEASIAPGGAAAFTLALEGAQGCSIAYRWRSSGTVGHLTVGDDVTTPSAAVTYRANAAGSGADTVSVEVLDTAGATPRTLFTREATVAVEDPCMLCSASGGRARGAAPSCPVPVEACCADGLDNDGDGAADCDDADCGSDPGCDDPPDPVCPVGVTPITVRGESCCPSGSGNGYTCGRWSCGLYLSGTGPGGCDLWCDYSVESSLCGPGVPGFPAGDPGRGCCCTVQGTSSCTYP